MGENVLQSALNGGAQVAPRLQIKIEHPFPSQGGSSLSRLVSAKRATGPRAIAEGVLGLDLTPIHLFSFKSTILQYSVYSRKSTAAAAMLMTVPLGDDPSHHCAHGCTLHPNSTTVALLAPYSGRLGTD